MKGREGVHGNAGHEQAGQKGRFKKKAQSGTGENARLERKGKDPLKND